MNQYLSEKRNLIYLFDLPKKEFTSTKLATYLQENGIPLKDSPQVRRDPTKLFYQAILHIQDEALYKKAINTLRYFEISGKQCRGLPFDNDLLRANMHTLHDRNLFVKNIPKGMSLESLHAKFKDFGTPSNSDDEKIIKSAKISINEDHSSSGYGFVCF